ncbi:hypothetical protein QTP86_015648 [Hemibagrus guttatus]|nr:hypothetical protein QTP86_015648 [Hemibagrus guttatus]
MQDILQIVVQAFLRMKKVRLDPSCLFVHQNVGHITAGEKNMERRRRLEENLDKMAKLAAKEEDCEANCFSKVIDFDVQNDVYYFAQLWEGSPPMAPPNPSYSRNVQNLKNKIFNKASKSHIQQLSQFKFRICDLWNALLSENFVFSFKNTLEIVVYRELETEFSKWTWALRANSMAIEEKFCNRIENENLQKIENTRETFNRKATQKEYDEKLLNLSKELAQELKGKEPDEVLHQKFDTMWNKWVTDLTQDISDKHYKNIDTLGDYSHYLPSHDLKVEKNDTPELSDDENIRLGDLIRNIINESEEKFKTICMSIEKLGYKDSYIQLITDHMKERVRNHNKADQIQVTKKLALHLCLLVCDLMSERIMEHHKRFRDSNDPRVYLSKQKPQYYRVFKCYCRGATAAHVFGELICNNLKESILQSVYNQTAVDLAAQIRSDMEEFNRNKTKLEKHILKHLAEKENFPEYMEYVHYPQKYFKSFISKQVHKYITENHTKVLQLFKINLNNMEQIIVKALNTATDEVKKSQGGIAEVKLGEDGGTLEELKSG